MAGTVIKGARIINRGASFYGDVYFENERIVKIGNQLSIANNHREISGDGLMLMPGIIDDQVHFREPGLTHKADIATESKAAVAGGVTTFMEMPNTIPNALTQELLEDKYNIASKTSYANYSFFMGASNENYDEVMKTDPKTVCGVKIFMGSSTGNMLVDSPEILDRLYANVSMLIATHCEDEATIRHNMESFKARYGDSLTPEMHPLIRDEKACLLSSTFASQLAKKHGTRLHILHISTADELVLFNNKIPLKEKRITSEVCVHHLYFSSDDYARLGNQIKCNPAIKAPINKNALFHALLDDRLDIIATDHAPHTWEEKSNPYSKAPSGLPLVQHSLNIMLDFYQKGMISLEKIVEKMCHAPSDCFNIQDRGFIDEGMYADIVLVDLNKEWIVDKSNIHFKCQWSPLEGKRFKGQVVKTIVSGNEVYNKEGEFKQGLGKRLLFN